MLSKSELIELLNELPAEPSVDTYRPKNVTLFVRECEEQGIPFSDIHWFIEWEPAMLRKIERQFSWYGFYKIFSDWEEYLKELEEGLDECFDNDPYQPYNGYVVNDAGLSGVWYISMY